MKKDCISVIVPVYKVEPWLERCMDSLLSQSFRELEIILVDDGSPDRCGEICDMYATQDPRVKVIHQENLGLSAARNTGLAAAEGEFIGFLDSDDWIEPDMYEYLHQNLIADQADIAGCALCGYHRAIPGQRVMTGREAIPYILTASLPGIYAWNKLYRRELFSDLRFPEGMVYEDIDLMPRLFLRAKRVTIGTAKKYHYTRRPDSITSRPFCPEELDRLRACDRIAAFVAENCPEHLDAARAKQDASCFPVLDRMLLANVKQSREKQELIRRLREHAPRILSDKRFTRGRRLTLLLLCVHERLYEMAIKLYYRTRR